jgi:DNA-binding transcriptional ArsR family regulator
MGEDTQERRLLPPEEQVDMAVEVFSMLVDPTRVRLVWALADRELSVNELADAVGKPAAGVSQHLAKLRMARVVRTRREGNHMYYRLQDQHVRELVEDAICHAEHALQHFPAHHRDDPPGSPRTSSTEPPRRPTSTERVAG